MRTFLVAALVLLAASAACVDQGAGPQPKRVDPGYVGKHLLQAPPATMTAKLDVDLGGKVIYLGNNLHVERAVPGQAFKITHYWKVVTPIGPGWEVFSNVRGEPTKPDFMNLPPTEMQRAHGPATWAAGEIIEDEQEIFLRPDWRSMYVTVHVGLIEVGAHGVGDRMAASGPNVKDRAVIARRIEIDLAKAPPPPGTVHVPYAQGPIAIDGVPSDQGWAGIGSSPEWVTAEGSPEPVGKASGKLTWDDQHLYVYVTVTDSDVFSEFQNQDDPLWKQDCVELFIDADGNRRGYVELQVSPNNVTFDSWFPGGRAAKGDEEWDSGMITAVKLNPGQGWDVEIAIPWAAVKGREDAMSVRLPPQVGDRWRLNVVRVDKKKQGTGNPTASSWNRISYQDWHGLEKLLTVVFADQSGGVAPGTPAKPAPVIVDPGVGSGSAIGSGSAAGTGSASGSGAPAVAPASGSSASRTGSTSGPSAGSAAPTSGSAAPRAGSASGSAAGSTAPRAGSSSGSAAPAATPPAGSAAPRAGSASGSAAPATGGAPSGTLVPGSAGSASAAR
ncbi:MAG: hypothetical protein H0T42_29505 [Deltaproteobacteria bacterium]|nr:hypothetical protein [Deltaproteobacteria bacterium]